MQYIAFGSHFKEIDPLLLFSQHLKKNMRKFLPYILQHGHHSCVLGITNYHYFPEKSFCRQSNSWFGTGAIYVNAMWETKINYYFHISEVLWNGCRYRKGTDWFRLWSQNIGGNRVVLFSRWRGGMCIRSSQIFIMTT